MRDLSVGQSDLAPELSGALLTIDLRALQNNWRYMADLAESDNRSPECGAAVKAACYGLGLTPVVTALAQAGCKSFFVALPQEGKEMRAVLPDADIYVLNGLMPGQAGFYQTHSLIPVLSTPVQVSEWQEYCRAQETKLPAALHLESGINRLGLTETQTRRLAGQRDVLSAFKLVLLMSHLACGDTPGDSMNIEQKERFDQLCALFPDTKTSLANSPGTFLGDDFTYDLVRPGIALYGGNPFANRANPMSAVVRLYAPLLQVRNMCAGESVGYGASWTAKRTSRIGVIGAGYGDGIPRTLSSPANDGPACVFIGGHYAPIIGRVSMDLITVDLTDVPEEIAMEGQRVELMGDNITVDDIARWSGTIPYEVLTSLGSRYARLYSPPDS
ncbi:Alanine racemase [hydrothermal vent metagenome]|uniref:Alanine racemase n=1 Tax=hydrothermal vent metagenome TaxID=652676 RepID=A0A3B0RNL1_9ZZZZ